MGRRVDNFVEGMLKPINPTASIILGALTASWGAWLLNPHSVFDSASLYSKMDQFAPEWAWGLWAFTCGMLIIISVLRSNWKWLAKAMGFACWHWSTVAGMMWWGDWQNTGGLTYSYITVYTVYIFLNVKINHVNDKVAVEV